MIEPGDIVFDDNGQPVQSVDFDYSALDPEAGTFETFRSAVQQETLDRFVLDLIDDDPNEKRLFRRFHLIAFYIKKGPCKTQAELAEKLGITEAAVSQRLKALKREISRVS